MNGTITLNIVETKKIIKLSKRKTMEYLKQLHQLFPTSKKDAILYLTTAHGLDKTTNLLLKKPECVHSTTIVSEYKVTDEFDTLRECLDTVLVKTEEEGFHIEETIYNADTCHYVLKSEGQKEYYDISLSKDILLSLAIEMVDKTENQIPLRAI